MSKVIQNATILTMAGDDHPCGFVWIEGDRISAVGDMSDLPALAANNPDLKRTLSAGSSAVIDATGMTCFPGMIDAHCHIGVFNDGLRSEGSDGNDISNPVTSDLCALDSIFYDDACFTDALAHGITSVMTGPGSANVIGGRFALMHTAGTDLSDMLIQEKVAMKAALGENPKRCYGTNQKLPGTRMGNAAVFRNALTEATWYKQQKEKKGDDLKPDPKMEALLPVLSGEQPIKIHVHRSDDILTAVRLCDEFGLRFTLDHCTEGYRIADRLAAYYVVHQSNDFGRGEPGRGKLEGIITGPLLSDRSKPELNRSRIQNTAQLVAAGLPVAIATDHPVVPIQYLPVSAAIAVRAGLPETAGLAAITSTAATILGFGDQLGRLATGYRADVLLLSGHPLDWRTTVKHVLINGKIVFTSND